MRVLIVEDEPYLAEAVQAGLRLEAIASDIAGDGHAALERLDTNEYDVVVLDPPKLIRNRAELEEGTRKHFDLNRIAMQLVAPGGLLLTCTCAGLLSRDEFLRLIYAGARQAGEEIAGSLPRRRAARTCQILHKTGAAPDHPIGTHCPETEYLQAVWLRLL